MGWVMEGLGGQRVHPPQYPPCYFEGAKPGWTPPGRGRWGATVAKRHSEGDGSCFGGARHTLTPLNDVGGGQGTPPAPPLEQEGGGGFPLDGHV